MMMCPYEDEGKYSGIDRLCRAYAIARRREEFEG